MNKLQTIGLLMWPTMSILGIYTNDYNVIMFGLLILILMACFIGVIEIWKK